MGKQPWRRPHRCKVCVKAVCGEHSTTRTAEQQTRVCEHCQQLEAKKKAKEEIKAEMVATKANIEAITAENYHLKASIEHFSDQIDSKQALFSDIQLTSSAHTRPLLTSVQLAKASNEELSPFLSQLQLSISLHSGSLAETQNRLISLHSQAQALVNSIAEESKTVQLLEREVRERRKKLRMTVTNEPCPHLRQASSRDDERDPLGSLACNLRCLLM